MSKIDQEITDLLINNLKFSDKTLSSRIKFDKNFIGFHGHFPDNPVLPGIIMIKVMIKMYELFREKDFFLSKIKKSKFIEPVLHNNYVTFKVTDKSNLNGVNLQGQVQKQEKTIAKISIILQDKIV